jgi:hypothetical protein
VTDPERRQGPSWQRIAVWVVVAAIAVWLIVSGISGIIAKGG